jgi:hypothetical protein
MTSAPPQPNPMAAGLPAGGPRRGRARPLGNPGGRAIMLPAFTRKADMSDYLIACVNKKLSSSGDEHIVSVGISGEPQKITVRQAYRRMDARHHLFTISPSTGAMVFVEKYRCCDMDTLRTVPDGVHDNNLDSLDPCP